MVNKGRVSAMHNLRMGGRLWNRMHGVMNWTARIWRIDSPTQSSRDGCKEKQRMGFDNAFHEKMTRRVFKHTK